MSPPTFVQPHVTCCNMQRDDSLDGNLPEPKVMAQEIVKKG